MSATRPQPSVRRGKKRGRLPLLTSSALIAIAAGASVAHGQAAFQGTPSFSGGNVSYSAVGNNTDVFTLGSHSAIIDWTPTDNQGTGTINFLPAGKTGIFQSSTDANFTVLNRINPANTSRPVEFDGHVVSQFVSASGAASRAGNVWFYTPGGIIVGATGVFDVGSLILTTDAIDTTNGVPSPGSGISFRGASGSLSNIIVQPGAQLNATNAGSYVALVAPRINQGGTVNVNGSVGYVAAEAADITINAGLFSITNTIGSQVAPGGETTLTHTGTTTGAAAIATGTPHVIYMVAIPKNDAVTMLVSGNVGYQAAASATVVNGNIVLGAGYTNNAGAFTPNQSQDGVETALGGGQASTIDVGAGAYSSPLFAYSNGTFALSSASGDIHAGTITATANRTLNLLATGGNMITAGNVSLSNFSSAPGPTDASVQVDVGSALLLGELALDVSNEFVGTTMGSAAMQVSGTARVAALSLTANAINSVGSGSPAPAGSASLTVDGGTLTVTNPNFASGAPGVQISAQALNGLGGAAVGGGTEIHVQNGGHASLTNVALSSSATGGANDARAGISDISVDSGSIVSVSGSATVSADASGATATGGSALIRVANGAALTFASGLDVAADATNGTGAAGAAMGGTASIDADTNGTLNISGATSLTAGGDASNASAAGGGTDAVGGTVSVTSSNGAAVNFDTLLTLSADATGAQVSTGSATAGSVTIQAFDGAITMPSFYVEAIARANPDATDAATVAQGGTGMVEARGGSITLTDATASSSIELGARGGIARGGIANLRARATGTISVAGTIALHADADGGTRTDAGATGYAGTGGSASVTADDGTLNLAGLDVSANGYGGDGVANGGNGFGGYTVLQAGPGGVIHNSGLTYLNTTGQGGTGGTGAANGTGGTSAVYADGATITLDDALGVMSTGNGGAALVSGRDPATQGIGQGGTSSLAADGGGTITLTGATIDSTGLGGVGAGGGVGGTGIGGTATFETGRDGQAGNVTAQLFYLRSEGTGGAPDASAGGDGGLGKGGLAQFSVGTGAVGMTTLLVASTGTGADGGPEFNRVTGPSGGNAAGGGTMVSVLGGTLTVQNGEIFTGAIAGAGAPGEYGGTGGNASGGIAQMQIAGGALSGGDWSVFETAQGGAGGSGSAGTGGAGGRADAGSIALTISNGTASINSLSASLTATGGAGGAGGTVTAGSFAVQDGLAGGGGGAATSGAASLTSANGSFATGGNLSLDNIATGGVGGAGGVGTGTSTTTGPGSGGAGGQGGGATAGSVGLVALGGTITSPRPSLAVNAVAGLGGDGGAGGTGVVAASGVAGSAAGGIATIQTDNQGLLALGDTSIDASTANATNGTGGTVNLLALDSSGTPPALAIGMTSLTVTNTGPANGTGGGQISVQAAAPVAVTGDASFTGTGDTGFTFSGIGNFTVGGNLSVTAASISGTQANAGAPTLTAASASFTTSAGDLTLDNLATTAGDINLDSAGALTIGSLSSAGSLTAGSAAILTIGTATAALDLTIDARTSIDVTTATAGRDAAIHTLVLNDTSIRPRSVTVGSVTAGDDAVVTGFGPVTVGSITTTGLGEDGTDSTNYGNIAGSGVLLYSDSAIHVHSINTLASVTAGNIVDPVSSIPGTAGTGGVALDSVTTQGTLTATSALDFVSLSNITASSVSASGKSVSISSPGALTISSATASAGDVTINAAGALDLTAATLTAAGGGITLSSGGAIGFGSMSADNDITVQAAGALTGASQTSNAGTISDSATGLIDIATLNAGNGIAVSAGGTSHFGTLTATGGGITLTSGDALGFGSMTADNDITIQATGALTGTGQTSNAGTISDSATGLVDITTLSAGNAIVVDAGGTGHFGTLAGGVNAASNDGTRDFGSIGLSTAGDLVIGTSATAAGSVGLLSATGRISAPALTAGGADGGISVLATGSIALGTVTAPGLFYSGGPAATSLDSNLSATQSFSLSGAAGPSPSGADVTIGATQVGSATITAGTTLALTGAFSTTAGNATLAAGGNITAGDLTSFGGLSATSTGGAVALGNVAAGNPTSGGGITLTGSGGITAGNLTGDNSIVANSSGGAVTLRQVTSSGGSARVTALGTITTGDVTAAGSIYLTGAAAITAGNLKAGIGTLLPGEGGTSGGTDPAPDGIATGFDQDSIERCDDCSTSTIALPFDVNFFGSNYSTTYVSNNGYFTFNSGQGTYTPSGLGTGYSGQAIIAAFFADVDTRDPGSGVVTYGTGTFAGRPAFAATWNGVGYYGAHSDKLNTFQIVLTNRADTGAGNFDIYYNYGNIGWETGDADDGVGGLGGTSAAVGFNAGIGNQAGTFFQLPGSLVPGSFINGGTAPLITTTNDGNAGQLLFSVRGGQVAAGGPGEPPTVHVSNIAAGNTADVHLGNISGEAAEVHGAGQVTVGNVTVADQHSGVAATGNPFATVLDASNGLISGDISGAGFVAIGAAQGDISTGTIASSSSVAVLGDGAISLGAVTTGQAVADTLFVSGNAAKANLTGFSYDTLLSGRSFDPATLATAVATPTGGAVAIGGPVSAGNITIAAGGDFTSGAIGATGAVSLTGAGIGVGGPLSAAKLTATSTGAFTSGVITTTGDASVGGTDVTIGGASAGGTLALVADGMLTLQGNVDAAAIALTSHDIAAAGQIGSSRTTALAFTNSGTGVTYAGAAGATASDYDLSATELGNAHGAAIAILAPGTGGIVIGDVALTNANLVGGSGSLLFDAAGNIQLGGHLGVTGLGAGNQVSLIAGQAITGTLPAAGISLTDASGGVAGRLNLQADRIEFDTAATAQAVAAAATLGDAGDALAVSDGAATPGSYIQAGGVRFTVGSALYMQNSGIVSTRREDRAGVTGGAGGISLASPGTGPVALVLNARLTNATGDVTGQDVVGQIQHGGQTPLTFAPMSTVNGCLTDGTPCTPPVEVVAQQIQPVQDVVQQIALPSGIGQSSSYSFQNPQLISMTDLAPATLAPLIDEPVTGAGNDNLWVGVGVSADQPLAPMGGAKSGNKPLPK